MSIQTLLLHFIFFHSLSAPNCAGLPQFEENSKKRKSYGSRVSMYGHFPHSCILPNNGSIDPDTEGPQSVLSSLLLLFVLLFLGQMELCIVGSRLEKKGKNIKKHTQFNWVFDKHL